jgi:hypothetical protein
MLYKNDTREIKIHIGANVDQATLLKIYVQKPDLSVAEWIGTKYDSSTITYTTQDDDLDQSGTYVLQTYIEWGSRKRTGSLRTIRVYEMFQPPVQDTIAAFKVWYKDVTVQSELEAYDGTNTGEDALSIDYISFLDFSHHLERATVELKNTLRTKGIANMDLLTRHTALAHLIRDYIEMGNPDWNNPSETTAPGVSFSRAATTAPRAAFNKLIWSFAPGISITKPFMLPVDPYFTRDMFDNKGI